MQKDILLPALALALLFFPARAKAADAAWMAGQYGVSFHFFAWFYPATTYDQAVDSFDVRAYADQVKASGAKWVVFGLQQNFRNLPSPNTSYETLTDRVPGQY